MAPKSEAEKYFEKAEKKANSSTGWFSSASSKYEEAGDLYQQAANSFKLDKEFKLAATAFAREAECRENCNEGNDAANAWWNAAKAFKTGGDFEGAVIALGKAITFMAKAGRFRQAADREKEVGQIYIQDLHDLSKAVESLERAAEWYQQEGAAASATSCLKDAADLLGELERYPEAIKNYETVAKENMSSPLTKYGIKEHFLRATLCALAMGDVVTAKRNLLRYESEDTAFSSSREGKLARYLSDAVENGDAESYTQAVFEYDQVLKLDNWKTSILLKIKKNMEEVEDAIL